MMTFTVSYEGETLTVIACDAEAAWDEYKRQTGKRRKDGDDPPSIVEVTEAFPNA